MRNIHKTAATLAGLVSVAVILFTSTPASAQSSTPQGAQILAKVYPDFVKGYENGYLLMTDGTKMQYDDGRKKSFEQKLDDADPEDMFAFKYDRRSWTPAYLQDAGRSRCEQLFKKMYGKSAAEVRKHLISVPWFGEKVLFTTINGAADSLRAVAKELEKHPELHSYLKSSGSFYWRKVRGANRQSAHSYGMTIDIAVAMVLIFEKHGFIWGGRWYHYDTMHFEFRPEILAANP